MTALTYAAAALLGVLGVARLTRLVTSDKWPPMGRLRDWWTTKTARDHDYDWEPLLTCPFCVAPYLTALALAGTIWAGIWSPDLSTLAGWWWVAAVWASGSYAAAMIVVRDEPAPVPE